MPKNIFVSYSHKDIESLEEIKKRLVIFELYKRLDIWVDTKIEAGDNFQQAIESSINNSTVALLLISNEFLSSNFILEKELPLLLNAAKRRRIILCNVVLDSCLFDSSGLEKYQCLHDPKVPLEKLKPQEKKEELVKIAMKLNALVIKSETAATALDSKQLNKIQTQGSFSKIILLSYLVKNGSKSITEIEKNTLIKRKIVVKVLEELLAENLILKDNKPEIINSNEPVAKKKPSVFWKASPLGFIYFKDFKEKLEPLMN